MTIRCHLARAAALAICIAFISTPLMAADHPGKPLWDRGKCHVCHGDDGKAQTPAGKKLGARDLSSDFVQKLSDDEIFAIIRNGKEKMPAWGHTFNDDEIRTLVSFVRTFAEKKK